MNSGILDYIRRTYLGVRYEFAIFATRSLRNFGVKATARTESSHAALKSQLRNRKGDLHELHTGILDMLNSQRGALEHIISNEKYKTLPKAHGKPQYHELQGTVSHFALAELVKNEEYAGEAIKDPCGKNFRCSGLYRVQFGLPCWHDSLRMVRENGHMRLLGIAAHWHLYKTGLPAELQAIYRLQDPRTLPRRQNGRAGDDHRRDRSHDELLAPRAPAPRVPPPPNPRPNPTLAPQRRQCSGCGSTEHNYRTCPLRRNE